MKKLFEEQKINLYKLQEELGLTNNYLYRYIKKRDKVEKMPVKVILDMAQYFKMTPNELIKKIKEYEGDSNE